jgi:hypothetical protein
MMPHSLRTVAATMIAALALTAGVPSAQVTSHAADRHLRVYKSPTCGCCAKWVEYMQANGFTATTTNVADVTPIKTEHGVPARVASCHTTLVGGYVIEGHVPVGDIRRLLREKPAIAGLAAPGMPAGSPGMDVPNSPAFEVLAFDKSGRTSVFASHPSK